MLKGTTRLVRAKVNLVFDSGKRIFRRGDLLKINTRVGPSGVHHFIHEGDADEKLFDTGRGKLLYTFSPWDEMDENWFEEVKDEG